MPATAQKNHSHLQTPDRKKAPPLRQFQSPRAVDIRRWFQFREGSSIDQIAAQDGRSPTVIQESIDRVKEWKETNSLDMLSTKTIEVAMRQMESVGDVLQRGMNAEKVIFVNQATGRVKKAPDIAMQLKSVAEVRGLFETVQPKGPLLQNNTQNNFGSPGFSGGSTLSFEAILRKKREAKGLLNAQDAEIIHEEMTHEESVADEFKDLGGDDEDEDGDEEDDE